MKFIVLEGQTHLANIQASDPQDAIKKARELYPGRSRITVEPIGSNDGNPNPANPMDLGETMKALKRMGRQGRRI